MGYIIGFIIGKILTFLLFCFLIGGILNLVKKSTPPKTLLHAVRSPSAFIPALILTLLTLVASFTASENEKREAEFTAFQRECVKKAMQQVSPEDAERGCTCVTTLFRERYPSVRALETAIKQGGEDIENLKVEGTARCAVQN